MKFYRGNLGQLCANLKVCPDEISEKIEYLKTIGEISFQLKTKAHCIEQVSSTEIDLEELALKLLDLFQGNFFQALIFALVFFFFFNVCL